MNPFTPDPVQQITKETLAELSRPALERMITILLKQQAELVRGLDDQLGLLIKRRETGKLVFHLHERDPETGECCSDKHWQVDQGQDFAATVLAGIRYLVTGELPPIGPPADGETNQTIRAA